jgi:hypothetical protein
MDLTRTEFIELAAPPCPECGKPIERTEFTHQRTPDGWRVSGAATVCGDGHRMPVEPLE